ncbi:hypothetical protein GGR54DRAFT_641069 [Hypoxylon sp. NC1633]|nr:hypothetical protein GGR54DRAFT_641069 [Hypoxylon sp. NC1633]
MDPSTCSPAPYGQACVGCSRAKCKCFYRSDGTTCERCHRLGKVCEPALAARKRKARSQPALQPPAQHHQAEQLFPSRLEEKLDDLVTLLRSQSAAKQGQEQAQVFGHTPKSTSEGPTLDGYGYSKSSTPAADGPDVVLDTTANVLHLLRPANSRTSLSPIPGDISVHQIPDDMAQEQLDLFRRSFLSGFPFIHIPTTTNAAELRHQRPFLWLVIMALTTKSVSQQTEMGETIWHIISRRIVSQHLADLDLLLGMICFAGWSHYFKQDKPFMTTVSQLAVSLAFELGIHQDTSTPVLRRSRLLPQMPARQSTRTMEERRTMLAVFHLTSSTWAAYRKTEPLRWTPYMDNCLRFLSEGRETHLDILLATQIKCQIITNQLSCPPAGELLGGDSSRAPWIFLTAALLRQLDDIRQNLPAQVESESSTQLYLHHTELKVHESLVGKPRPLDQAGLSRFQRLQDLESVLSSAERWVADIFGMPSHEWIGITVDVFAQFSQCMVILFKLATLDEPGWDLENVRRRADVFQILDRAYEIIDSGTAILGIVDTDGPQGSLPCLFSKTTYLIRAVKALFLAEMPPNMMPPAASFPTPDSGGGGNDTGGAFEFTEDAMLGDEFFLNMMHEDILDPTWDFRPESSYIPAFPPL